MQTQWARAGEQLGLADGELRAGQKMPRRNKSKAPAGIGPAAAPGTRPLRVGEEIRHALAAVLGRGELRDPALAGRSITVSEVRVSPDLTHATAFVTPLGGGDVDAVVAALRRAAPYLRVQVAKAVKLRRAPEIAFAADTSFDYASRIDEALRAPEVQRDVGAPDAAPEDAAGRRGRHGKEA